VGGCGLSQVVRGCRATAQRPCAGSQGRLRGTRAVARHPCALPCSIPAAIRFIKYTPFKLLTCPFFFADLIYPLKKAPMKNLCILGLLSLTFGLTHAQKVFSVDYENQADVKIFAVNYENQADLKVFKVKYENQAGSNDGKWFFTQYSNQAKKKVYFVKYENQADLKVFFVDYENQAGWRNSAKKSLMY
jgi:hypothetical protein